jgi:DeoR/GlpR family transcriptional regulator of sugar metabolism
LRRTYGGATAAETGDELRFQAKLALHLQEKRAIGALAATLLPEGSLIGCSGGTTVLSMIKALRGKRVTIVTNAVNVAMELASVESVEVIVTGGTLRPQTYELVGHLADSTIRGFRFDVAVLGVDAISLEHGLSTYTLADAHTDSLYLTQAEQVWVVADHSKFGKVGPVLIAPLDKVQRLITDPGLAEEDRARLQAAGVETLVAQL